MNQHDLRSALASGWAHGRTGRAVAGLAETRRLFPAIQADGDDWMAAECMLQMAWFCLQVGHPDHGMDCADGAKRLFLRAGDRARHAYASALHAWLMIEIGLVDEAFEESQVAVALAEATSDGKVLAFALHSKAVALTMSRQDELAVVLLHRAIAIAEGFDDLSLLSLLNIGVGYSLGSGGDALRNTGLIDESEELYEECQLYFSKAADQARLCGDIWTLRLALINGAEGEVLLDRAPEALALLSEADALIGPHGVRSDIHYLYTLGQAMLHLNRAAEALVLCEKAVALAESHSHLDLRVNTLRRLSEVHETLGNFEQATHFYKKFHVTYDQQIGDLTRRRAQMTEMRLENARLRSIAEKFERLATHDALTGLPNRRSFDGKLAQMRGKTFGIAILDLDNFKQVNDRHSHGVGDDVLRWTGELLAANGADAMPFRLGGEEFALLFSHADRALAHASAERIREALQALPWHELGTGLSVTTSIGLAMGDDGIQLLAAADRSLYRAKALGRNVVVVDWDDAEGVVRRA